MTEKTSLASTEEDAEEVRASPEERLIAAFLGRALRDALGDGYPNDNGSSTKSARVRIARDAKNWIASQTTPSKPFSFIWVCEALDIDPIDITRRLKVLEELSETPDVMIVNVSSLRPDLSRGVTIRTRTEYLLEVLRRRGAPSKSKPPK